MKSAETVIEDLVRIQTGFEGSLKDAKAACSCLNRIWGAKHLCDSIVEDGHRSLREAMLERLQGDEGVLEKWLEGVVSQLRDGSMPS